MVADKYARLAVEELSLIAYLDLGFRVRRPDRVKP